MQHNLFQLTLDNKLQLCPHVESAKRVLDAGTGTGVWAIDFGRCFPRRPSWESDVNGC